MSDDKIEVTRFVILGALFASCGTSSAGFRRCDGGQSWRRRMRSYRIPALRWQAQGGG
jgi:hypothetical protein